MQFSLIIWQAHWFKHLSDLKFNLLFTCGMSYVNGWWLHISISFIIFTLDAYVMVYNAVIFMRVHYMLMIGVMWWYRSLNFCYINCKLITFCKGSHITQVYVRCCSHSHLLLQYCLSAAYVNGLCFSWLLILYDHLILLSPIV